MSLYVYIHKKKDNFGYPFKQMVVLPGTFFCIAYKDFFTNVLFGTIQKMLRFSDSFVYTLI